ncbi:MAG TPA: hypothetical protein VH184_23485 [Dongiaceae bacterium]|jgi:Holliday junction resolvasome RuvABC endonuclease subunit|nr:hypothetical protein [Dongiaceae bacterium]
MIRNRGLAFDLGIRTGWAADDTEGTIPLAGLWQIDHKKLGMAFLQLEGEVFRAVRQLKPDYLCYEAAIAAPWGKTNADTSRKLLGFGTVVMMTAARLGLPCFDVNLTSARKYLTGNGRASKSDVWYHCKNNGWPDDDLNKCDAICVLVFARARFGVQQLLGRTIDG